LRVRPAAIAEDLGVQLEDVVHGLPEVAKTLGSIRDIVAHAYPWRDFSTDWSQNTLSAAISKVLPPRGGVNEFLESPLNQAMQTYSVVQDRPAYSDSPTATFTLRTNRLCYAQWLLSGKFPAGGWHLESKAHRFSLDDLLDPAHPCLVEASIELNNSFGGDGVTPSLVAFGSSSFGAGKEALRRWISQPELAWLSRYARIHISSVLFCRDAQPLPEEMALPAILTADPLLSLSIACGVVAECHWNAVAASTYVRRPGPGGTVRFNTIYTPVAVWLRAMDRAYCFAMARKAASMGFHVSAYGYGSVSVWSAKDDLGPLFELSQALSCCHPNLAAMQERIGLYSSEGA
jgi:hypothetical protein